MATRPLTLTLTRPDGKYASAAIEANPDVYGDDPLSNPDFLVETVAALRTALRAMPIEADHTPQGHDWTGLAKQPRGHA